MRKWFSHSPGPTRRRVLGGAGAAMVGGFGRGDESPLPFDDEDEESGFEETFSTPDTGYDPDRWERKTYDGGTATQTGDDSMRFTSDSYSYYAIWTDQVFEPPVELTITTDEWNPAYGSAVHVGWTNPSTYLADEHGRSASRFKTARDNVHMGFRKEDHGIRLVTQRDSPLETEGDARENMESVQRSRDELGYTNNGSHTFTLSWTGELVTVSMDGEEILSSDEYIPTQQFPLYIVAHEWTGGNCTELMIEELSVTQLPERDGETGSPTPRPRPESTPTEDDDPVLMQSFKENAGVVGLLVAMGATLGMAGLGVIGYGTYRVLGNSSGEDSSNDETAASADSDDSSPTAEADSESAYGADSSPGGDTPAHQIDNYADLDLGPTVEESSTYHLRAAATPAGQSVCVATPPEGHGTTWRSDVISAFAETGETWAKLDPHPHLLTVHASGLDSFPWIALEPVDGQSLGNRADNLTAEDVIDVIGQACEAIHHLHRYGLAYENLTPEGILVDEENFATLRGVLDHLQDPARTPYDPPTADDVAASADIYRLGAITSELLTGTVPDPEQRSSATDLEPSLPATIDDVLSKALAPDPALRHGTALHLRDELQSLRESL